jgi:hypothetical protein
MKPCASVHCLSVVDLVFTRDDRWVVRRMCNLRYGVGFYTRPARTEQPVSEGFAEVRRYMHHQRSAAHSLSCTIFVPVWSGLRDAGVINSQIFWILRSPDDPAICHRAAYLVSIDSLCQVSRVPPRVQCSILCLAAHMRVILAWCACETYASTVVISRMFSIGNEHSRHPILVSVHSMCRIVNCEGGGVIRTIDDMHGVQ